MLLAVNRHLSSSHSGTTGKHLKATAWLRATRSIPALEHVTGRPSSSAAGLQLWLEQHKSQDIPANSSRQRSSTLSWQDLWAPRYTPQRVILSCNCDGLKLAPAIDKGDIPQNSGGSRIKPQDHINPAVAIRKYCVIVINTIAKQESCCHISTWGKESLNKIHLN